MPTPPVVQELGTLQRQYPPCLAHLILHIYSQGYQCSMGESYVGDTDGKDGDHDGPHRKDGGHYKRIATDLNVFKDGMWLKTGNEPIWPVLGRFWESLHPNARWTASDPNHFGFFHKGVF
jgi:hypothetical protein